MAIPAPIDGNALWCMRYGIGDVVMELPLIDPLRASAPGLRITVLGAEPAIQLLDRDERLDGRVSLQDLGLTHRWDRGTAEIRQRIRDWLQQSDFDLVLDCRHAPPGVAEIVYQLGLQRVDSDPTAESAAVAAGKDAVGAIQAAVAAGWGLRIPAAEAAPVYRPRPEDIRFAKQWLEPDVAGRPIVGIAPVASLNLKRWPLHAFAELARWAVEDLGARVLLFCGPDKEVAAEVLRHADMREPPTVVGALHLGRISALLAHCDLLVANDTGITHIAAAVGTRTLGIFGPTAPWIYKPANRSAFSIGGEDVGCPHRNERSLEPPKCWFTDQCLLGGHGCIRQVELRDVQGVVERMLAMVEVAGARSVRPSASGAGRGDGAGRGRGGATGDPC